jgi:hypothetical protein
MRTFLVIIIYITLCITNARAEESLADKLTKHALKDTPTEHLLPENLYNKTISFRKTSSRGLVLPFTAHFDKIDYRKTNTDSPFGTGETTITNYKYQILEPKRSSIALIKGYEIIDAKWYPEFSSRGGFANPKIFTTSSFIIIYSITLIAEDENTGIAILRHLDPTLTIFHEEPRSVEYLEKIISDRESNYDFYHYYIELGTYNINDNTIIKPK